MTVGELISELQQYPAHYTAVLEFGYDNELNLRHALIEGASIQSNNGDIGPWVAIRELVS